MDHLSNLIVGSNIRYPHRQASMLQDDTLDDTGALDGSVTAMCRFLEQMAALADEPGDGSGAPLLKLLFGDIDTVTSISAGGGVPCLSITALMPRRAVPDPLQAVRSPAPHDSEILWDAGEGRYVMVRRTPVAQFADERSVLDAILNAADDAKAWFAVAVDRKEPAR